MPLLRTAALASLCVTLLACGAKPIEEKTLALGPQQEPAPRVTRRTSGTSSSLSTGGGAQNLNPPSSYEEMASSQEGFSAFDKTSKGDLVLSLLETPSSEHSVEVIGNNGDEVILKVVLAPKALKGVNDEGAGIMVSERVRIIRGRVSEIGDERLGMAIAKNAEIHAQGGFPYHPSQPTTEELVYRKLLEAPK
ncbi:MAG: hypothetical protein KDB07_00445 [Planctomycetes bacterium]|nr:hypothetical protein [Planctomycetota bacterium]